MRLLKRRFADGFTLIEVLIALAIIAITLGTGLRVSGLQITSATRQQDMFRAQLCAENELIKIRLQRQFPDLGERSFQCEQAGVVLPGRVLIEDTPNPSIRRISVIMHSATTAQTVQPSSATTGSKTAAAPESAYQLIWLSTVMARF